jgi:hypothetical protein
MRTFLPIAATLLILGTPSASTLAGSPDALARLGTTLTPFGAEKAGNADGSIPPYTGGLPITTRPTGYKKDSGRWANPYADEKPLYSITRQNYVSYGAKLSETNKALFQRYPNYRMDVYPAHRSVSYPAWVLDNSLKNASSGHLGKNGIDVEGAFAGVPFPLPASGIEVIWNQLARYNGYAMDQHVRMWFVAANGQAVNSGQVRMSVQNPYYDPRGNAETWARDGRYVLQYAYDFTGPPQVIGNANLYMDTLNPADKPRRAWAYSAATRRTRIAPDIAYDTPVASTGGVLTYDEFYVIQGAPDLYDFKLLGKREMLIPYNSYTLNFDVPGQTLMTPAFINPDAVRWELHRVWVVEGTLKPGKRHTVARRLYYIDEDMGGGGMNDGFDASGKLTRGVFMSFFQLYDVQIPMAGAFWGYDLKSGLYGVGATYSDPGLGLWIKPEGFPRLTFTPDALPTRGGR